MRRRDPERSGGGRDLEPARRRDPEPVHAGDIESPAPGDAGRRALEVGQEVLITGGIFEGQTGVIEGFLPSGKLRIAVETRRSRAAARVDPGHVEPLGISVDGFEEPG